MVEIRTGLSAACLEIGMEAVSKHHLVGKCPATHHDCLTATCSPPYVGVCCGVLWSVSGESRDLCPTTTHEGLQGHRVVTIILLRIIQIKF